MKAFFKNQISEVALEELGFIPFAQIGRPHGLKGGFFLKTSDNRSSWPLYPEILIETKDYYVKKKVTSHYISGKALVIHLDEFSREECENLYLKKIYVHKNYLKTKDDEMLVHDLLQFKVKTKEHGIIGHISAVVSFGAQENLEIELTSEFVDNTKGKQKHAYYPFMEKFILETDHINKILTIEWVEIFLTGKV